MRKFSINCKFFIEYVFIYILFLFLSLLPIVIVSELGGKIFRYLGPFSKKNKIAISNYKKIFINLNDKEIKKKVLESWENLGRTFFELSILQKILYKKNKIIEIKGIENIQSSIKKKEQIIFFGIHQSNWEICVPIIDSLGIDVGAIYRHINNKFIDKIIFNKRTKSLSSKNSFYTPKGKKSAKDILQAIQSNKSLFLLVDQKDSAGVDVKFFNINTKTQTGFIKIARKYNLNLVPVKNIRNKKNNFTITFCQPIKLNNKNLSDSESMLVIHKILEKWILENPTQWLWQHNRFN